MDKYETAIADIEETIDELCNDDGSLDSWIENLNLAIQCMTAIKGLHDLIV